MHLTVRWDVSLCWQMIAIHQSGAAQSITRFGAIQNKVVCRVVVAIAFEPGVRFVLKLTLHAKHLVSQPHGIPSDRCLGAGADMHDEVVH
jgi:hypothetical protein